MESWPGGGRSHDPRAVPGRDLSSPEPSLFAAYFVASEALANVDQVRAGIGVTVMCCAPIGVEVQISDMWVGGHPSRVLDSEDSPDRVEALEGPSDILQSTPEPGHGDRQNSPCRTDNRPGIDYPIGLNPDARVTSPLTLA